VPSNFMRKVEPFVAVPATQSCDASLLAAAKSGDGTRNRSGSEPRSPVLSLHIVRRERSIGSVYR